MTSHAEDHIRKRALEVTSQLTGYHIERIRETVEQGEDAQGDVGPAHDFRAVFDFAMDVHRGANQFHEQEMAKAQAEIDQISKDRHALAVACDAMCSITTENLKLSNDELCRIADGVKGAAVDLLALSDERDRLRTVLSLLSEQCEAQAVFAMVTGLSSDQHYQRGLGMGALIQAKALLAPVDIDTEDAVDDAVGDVIAGG